MKRFFTLNNEEIIIWRTCSVTGFKYLVSVKKVDFDDWENGKLAQNAFPYLDSDQREFLISNTTPAECKKMFGQWLKKRNDNTICKKII